MTERNRGEAEAREREAWLGGQREALEAALNGAPLETSLGVLVRTSTEWLGQDTRAAFYRASRDGTSLDHVVGMSAAYAEAVGGFEIGPDSLACGLAACTGQPVLTRDVQEEPRWRPWLWLAERFEYRGCWSFPVHTAAGRLLGTFAVYSREPREATERDLEAASLLTGTAGMIIAHHAESEARERAEQALRGSEERFRMLADNMAQLAWTCDELGNVTWYNRRWLEYTGLSFDDMKGWDWSKVQHPDHLERVVARVRRSAEAGEPWEDTFPLRGKDGSYRWFLSRAQPIRDGAGEVVCWFGTNTDVDDQLRAEEALLTNEARSQAEADALARLNELTSELWRMRSLHEGLDAMLDATIELLGADMGHVQLLDVERGVLRIASQRGFPLDFVDFFREVSPGKDTAFGRAFLSRERLIVGDVEADAPYAPFRSIARAAGYRAVQSTPLIGRDGAPLGMLSTHFRAVHRPDEQELRRLDLYARQAADFIERCRTDETLREADRRKDEYLAMLAHELRNPLAAISNAHQVLVRSDAGARELRSANEILDRQVGHLAHQIDQLLDVSRMSRGKIALREQEVELAPIVNDAVASVRPLCESRRHALTVTLPSHPLRVRGDPERLAQIVENLLSNACKFTDPGGRIRVEVERQGDRAVVRVRDSGIGIAATDLRRIFEVFEQVDRSLARASDGLGLGLALVKSLVEMHGGTVEARSAGLGRGSELVVRLPLLSGPPSAPRRELPGSAAEPPPTARRILVADDNRDSADSLAMLLTLKGHEVETAHDGREALGRAATFRADVVLLDIGMPHLDGYEVARRIRREQGGSAPRLVALTGWGQEEDRRRSEEAGFDAHFVKPVDLAALTKLLAEWGVG